MTPGQKLSLLLAATVDPACSVTERARAGIVLESIYDRPEDPGHHLLVGQRLTQDGLVALRIELPPSCPAHFPAVVGDVLRRARAAGYPCTGIRVEPVASEARTGWRVDWSGDGWQAFSRVSEDPIAAQNRADLAAAAVECGLEVVPDAAPVMLVLTPVAEQIIRLEPQMDEVLEKDRKLWDAYCRASDRTRARFAELEDGYERFREVDDKLFAEYLDFSTRNVLARYAVSSPATSEASASDDE